MSIERHNDPNEKLYWMGPDKEEHTIAPHGVVRKDQTLELQRDALQRRLHSLEHKRVFLRELQSREEANRTPSPDNHDTLEPEIESAPAVVASGNVAVSSAQPSSKEAQEKKLAEEAAAAAVREAAAAEQARKEAADKAEAEAAKQRAREAEEKRRKDAEEKAKRDAEAAAAAKPAAKPSAAPAPPKPKEGGGCCAAM